jgi:hypothetical protein
VVTDGGSLTPMSDLWAREKAEENLLLLLHEIIEHEVFLSFSIHCLLVYIFLRRERRERPLKRHYSNYKEA